MTERDLRRLFVESGALLSGHFSLSSGLHSGQYFQCALLLADPRSAEALGKALGALARKARWQAESVVSPALGGIIIGHETARSLGLKAYFAERGTEGALALRRGFTLKRGERVLVVEDVVTTGRSTQETISLIRSLGAEPVGAAAIVLREESSPELGVPLLRLALWPARSFPRDSCPLCAQGRPLVKPGSR
ncbi:MAG: orotate phosphoribosyltransferase [Elusimicrobia bacterium]|nr:orotate phosphoribosyltransferase [Elusimicrobiota bacterium]